MAEWDILIRNGRVVDPSRNVDAVGDIAVKDGRIADAASAGSAAIEIDAAGKMVLPGLIDFHAHVFYGGSDFSLPPDMFCFPSGVTTVVDAGSAGAANYRAFRTYVSTQRTRVKSLLNVCASGLGTLGFHENVDPANWNRRAIAAMYNAHRSDLQGLKIRQSRDIVGRLGLTPLAETLKLAGEIGCRVVVHVTDPPAGQEEIAAMLRPNDILCHVFQGTGRTILENGHVHPGIRAARARGVLFDACNGMSHFSFAVAETAIAEGFLPDILSTDATVGTLYKDYVFGLPQLMAKYLYLGIALPDVVRMTTAAPAATMGMAGEIGTLAPGACADIAVMSLRESPVAFVDALGERRAWNRNLVPEMTISAGQIVYRQFDFV